MGAPSDAGVVQLCEVAGSVASARGHRLGDWTSEDAGRRAECRCCGLVAYVRVEGGLSGMIGRALSEPCRPFGEQPPAVA
jgi:hypothetical protein